MHTWLSKIARLLILVCGINALLKFPIFINKIQIFEILLSIIFLAMGFPLLKKLWTKPEERLLWYFWTPIDSALVGLCALMIVNIIAHPTQQVALEGLATFYILFIYFIFSRFIYRFGDYMPLVKIWFWTGLLAGCAGFLGLLLYYVDYSKKFVFLYENYPYFGDIVRMKGVCSSPNTLVSILIFSFFMTNAWIKGSKQLIFNILICIMLLATYSKEGIYFLGLILLLALNHFLSPYFSKKQQTCFYRISYVLLWLGCIATSLWVVQVSGSEFIPDQVGEPISIGGSLVARPTGYWYLLESAWRYIQQNPWLGIGLGNFETQINLDQMAGLYPTNVSTYEAHDLYWGMVAQLGIAYILFLIIFIWSFKKCIDSLLADAIIPKSLILSIQYIGLFILLDMIGDVGAFHFRHYWIVFGLLSGLYAFSKKQLRT